MPKPIIRFGTTSASSSVSRIIFIALSISSSIFLRPVSRWSFSFFLASSNFVFLFTQVILKSVHCSSISATPITFGIPPTRMLKLQEKTSCKGVILNSFFITASLSCPRFKSIVILRPDKSDSSRTSEISFSLPSFTCSTILSIIASIVVVGGISVTSIQFAVLS